MQNVYVIFTRGDVNLKLRKYEFSEILFMEFFLVSLAVTNLDSYLVFLRKRNARFTVKALLDSNEVVLEPDAAFILDGSIKVIKNILDGTKRFIRFYK